MKRPAERHNSFLSIATSQTLRAAPLIALLTLLVILEYEGLPAFLAWLGAVVLAVSGHALAYTQGRLDTWLYVVEMKRFCEEWEGEEE